jgi:hypothetical protein
MVADNIVFGGDVEEVGGGFVFPPAPIPFNILRDDEEVLIFG